MTFVSIDFDEGGQGRDGGEVSNRDYSSMEEVGSCEDENEEATRKLENERSITMEEQHNLDELKHNKKYAQRR